MIRSTKVMNHTNNNNNNNVNGIGQQQQRRQQQQQQHNVVLRRKRSNNTSSSSSSSISIRKLILILSTILLFLTVLIIYKLVGMLGRRSGRKRYFNNQRHEEELARRRRGRGREGRLGGAAGGGGNVSGYNNRGKVPRMNPKVIRHNYDDDVPPPPSSSLSGNVGGFLSGIFGVGKNDGKGLKNKFQSKLDRVLSGSYQLVDLYIPDGSLSSSNNNKKNNNNVYGRNGAADGDAGGGGGSGAVRGYYDEGVIGYFCKVDWQSHKKDPSSVPMFRDLVSNSMDCTNNRFGIPLKTVVKHSRKLDSDNNNNNNGEHQEEGEEEEEEEEEEGKHKKEKNYDDDMIPTKAKAATTKATTPAVKNLIPSGFVFHESRCGSTLVANSLVAANPQAHRVYSESQPPIMVMRACENDGNNNYNNDDRRGQEDSSDNDCSLDNAASLLQDVIYIMGRTNDLQETKQFYKFQSIAATVLPVVRMAFPEVPWIFVYRDPIQVLISHVDPLSPPRRIQNANCLRSKKRPSAIYKRIIKDKMKEMKKVYEDFTLEDHCAAHMATICEGAKNEQEVSHHSGVMVNYKNLPQVLISSIFPHHFKIPMTSTSIKRIEETSTKYSKHREPPPGKRLVVGKGRAGLGDANGQWVQDSQEKDSRATLEIRNSAQLFLQPYYNWLEEQGEEYLKQFPMQEE